MSQYLLDTNIVAFMLRNRRDVLDRMLEVGVDNCHISEITYAELLYGVKCSSHPKQNLRALATFIRGIDVIPIGNSIEVFSDTKAYLRKIGKMVDDADLLIGATAIANDMIMVTENIRHFENMPGIKLENWVKR